MHREGGMEHMTKTTISWSVLAFQDLKYLFEAAQHILGILELPIVDALKLYCEPNPNENSNEAYIVLPRILNQIEFRNMPSFCYITY